MIAFPKAKINLGLHVLRRRPDGYHQIETILVPVGWCDAVEVVAATGELCQPTDDPGLPVFFSSSGAELGIAPSANLCYRAALLMQADHGVPAVKMHLHKCIPAGAGLGGGSSDAAAVLVLLNQIFGVDLTRDQLRGQAARLGSDCPFFIEARTAVARGRGDELEDIDLRLDGLWVVLVKPPRRVSTAEAYGWVTPQSERPSLTEIVSTPLSGWKDFVKNDFEAPVAERFPEIMEIKKKLYGLGAVYASMTGSGSAVFGFFESPVSLKSEFHGMETWLGPAG